MTGSVSESPRVAIQGEAGAFSHQAAVQLFGGDLELVPTRTFDALMASVVEGRAEVAVIPVENTLAGSVQGNLDRILDQDLEVVSETRVRIQLCLVAPPGRELSAIRTAASHPVALQQCQRFFRDHPEIEPVPVYDTAGSVRDLMSGGSAYDAAIGSALAADLYGARILISEMEDHPGNFTRFFAAARRPREESGTGSKTSLAFVVAHEPGSLHRALGVFAEQGIDLTKLESRPIPGRPWEYRFFADVRGDVSGPLGSCIQALAEITTELRILGSYSEWPEDR